MHDYYPTRRTMERVTVKGDWPAGVMGPYLPYTIEANGTVKPAIAEGTRPGPKRAFDRYCVRMNRVPMRRANPRVLAH